MIRVVSQQQRTASMSKFHRKMSRVLSLVLRHDPHSIGLSLDDDGWGLIDDLIVGLRKDGKKISREIIERVVETSDQKRFTISEDGLMIRANEGHSVSINMEMVEKEPPTWLFHGTSAAAMELIEKEGLNKKEREFVHLTSDQASARKIAERKGKPVVVEIASKLMHKYDHVFYLADNGVWLTDHVPPDYLNKRTKLY